MVELMQSPRVSILMVTYNRAKFIEGAIKSALGQTYQDWELIISDDSEKNDTAEVAEKFKSDPRIKYFHREKKGTIANSSNFALNKAMGEYIAILDDDDWWNDPKKLEKQVAFLDSRPDYVGAGGGFVIVNENNEQTGKILKPETDQAIRRVALYANPMANSTTMFRTAPAREFGGYDESLPQLADWDFWLKMGMKGKLYNAPEYFLAYRMWSQGSSFKFQKPIVDSAYRIVRRHKNDYPGFSKGIILNRLYWLYARFPLFIRRNANASLSKLKKILFSS